MNDTNEKVKEFIEKNSKNLIFRKVKTLFKPQNIYGVTEPHIIRSNDNYELQEIFFSVEDHFFDTPLDIYLLRPGVIICGTVKNTEFGPYYDKWFISNYKFLTLWTNIHCENHPSLFGTKQFVIKNFKF